MAKTQGTAKKRTKQVSNSSPDPSPAPTPGAGADDRVETERKTGISPATADARRRSLEALRDDCRRHAEVPVELLRIQTSRAGDAGAPRPFGHYVSWFFVTRPAIAGDEVVVEYLEHRLEATSGVAAERAKNFLERLGDCLRSCPDAEEILGVDPVVRANDAGDQLRRAADLIAQRGTHRAYVRGTRDASITEVTAEVIASEGRPERILALPGGVREWRVGDVVAAIAELCDGLLGDKPSGEKKRKRVPRDERVAHALLSLTRFRKEGRDPTDAEVARDIGVSPSTFSEQVARGDVWKRGRQAAVRDRPRGESK